MVSDASHNHGDPTSCPSTAQSRPCEVGVVYILGSRTEFQDEQLLHSSQSGVLVLVGSGKGMRLTHHTIIFRVPCHANRRTQLAPKFRRARPRPRPSSQYPWLWIRHIGASKNSLVSIVDEVVEEKDWLTIRSFSAVQVTAQRDPMSSIHSIELDHGQATAVYVLCDGVDNLVKSCETRLSRS